MQRTAQLKVWSPTVAVTVVRPGATAVTLPWSSTVATAVSSLAQVTSPSAPLTVSCWLSPALSRVMSLALRPTVVCSAGASSPSAAASGSQVQLTVHWADWPFSNVAVMVAIGVNDDGYREVIGAAEGFTESAECWREFLSWLKGRGLSGVRMFTGDKAAAMTGAIAEVFPDAAYQRCTVHFYRNVLSKVPKSKRGQAAAMLKAIHAQESFDASMEKAGAVAEALDEMRLAAASKCVREGVVETLTYTRFPMRHWRRIRTNNAIERLNREIRRRTRVVGTFPDGRSALMLVTARLKYVADSEWGSRRYLDVSLLDE